MMIAGTFAFIQFAPAASAAAPTIAPIMVADTSIQPSADTPSSAVQVQVNASSPHGSQQSSVNRTAGQDPLVHEYDATGYNGNSTIYPTISAGPYTLPTVSSSAYQTNLNSSLYEYNTGIANGNILNVSDIPGEITGYQTLQTLEGPVFYVYVWVTSTDGGQTYFFDPTGCVTPEWTMVPYAQELTVTPSGLPSENTNEFQTGSDTGTNLTVGNLVTRHSGSLDLLPLIGLGLDAAAVVFPEWGLGFAAVSGGLDVYGFLTGPSGATTNSYITSNLDVPGDNPATEIDVVNNGSTPCSVSPSDAGQNVFAQSDEIEEVLNASYLPSVAPGRLTVSSSDILQYSDPSETFDETGATASISYPIMPAISVGGTIDLWNNGPPVSGASSVIQQQYDNQTWFQSNLAETNSSGGYHDFLDPDVWFSQASAMFSDPLGTSSVDSNYCPSSCGGYTNQIPIGASWSGTKWAEGSDNPLNMHVDGGQVHGRVTGISGSGQLVSVPGATVTLSNSNGSVSTKTDQNGEYSFDFPDSGTPAHPYTITISAAGWPMTTVNYLSLNVGQSTEEDLEFSPTYPVTFTASGLPSGSTWTVTLAGQRQSATIPTYQIDFQETNGTYDYSITDSAGYTASPASGAITVSGSSMSKTITFSPPQYSVTFNEYGLPSGVLWSMASFDGQGAKNAYAPNSIAYNVGDGTWSFTANDADAQCVSGRNWAYVPNPSSGQITVSGGSVQQPIDYQNQEVGGFCGGCVVWGTPILTPSGYVAVQNLKSGDSIEEYNVTAHQMVQGTFLWGNVTHVKEYVDVNHGWLRLTSIDQPVYIRNGSYVGWLHDPQNLTTADSIFDPVSGQWVQVTSIQFVHWHVRVFDVVDDGDHDFIANGALLQDKHA